VKIVKIVPAGRWSCASLVYDSEMELRWDATYYGTVLSTRSS